MKEKSCEKENYRCKMNWSDRLIKKRYRSRNRIRFRCHLICLRAARQRVVRSKGKELVILIDDKEKTELAKIINTGIDINRNIVYTVKSGDNLSLIAQRYKVKVSQIRDWNNLNEKDILQPGDKLTITINVVNSNLS